VIPVELRIDRTPPHDGGSHAPGARSARSADDAGRPGHLMLHTRPGLPSFLGAASDFFLPLISEENLFDPQEKRRYFDWSWQAVRYRYRSCAECQDEFRALLTNASDLWHAWSADEEQNYKLERCIYVFFMSGLSVFDSFSVCLYFLGNAMQPGDFPAVGNPRNITRTASGG
jgi:hypothetical protein